MSERSKELRLVFEDNFDAAELNRNVWLPHYLPAWSSSAETAATYAIKDSCLHLTIPASQGLWCAGDHRPPLRCRESSPATFPGPSAARSVSSLTVTGSPSASSSRPSGAGRQSMATSRSVPAASSHRSMVAFWLAGIEDQPQRSGEICIGEMFGDGVVAGKSTAVGLGLHAFRDPQ